MFLVCCGLFLAPVVPGKIWNDAPGSSQTFSTGDQNIDCLGTVGKLTTTTTYDTKAGFPLVYNYSTTSHLSAPCGGKVMTAAGGHTSQFNPLGLLADILLALAIGIITAKIWRRFRAND